MKPQILIAAAALVLVACFCRPVMAQASSSATSTPPISAADREAVYSQAIENRTLNIMKALAVTDAAASNRVHDIILTHYRALRARDEAIDDELSDLAPGSDEWRTQRNAIFTSMSRPFHDRFIAALSKELTPAQIDIVKDQLTYGKVQFTYNAYCSIVPTLTDGEKAQIMDLLKQAREEAMEGGSAGEKSDIFQQ
jgi:hypothetical protein